MHDQKIVHMGKNVSCLGLFVDREIYIHSCSQTHSDVGI